MREDVSNGSRRLWNCRGVASDWFIEIQRAAFDTLQEQHGRKGLGERRDRVGCIDGGRQAVLDIVQSEATFPDKPTDLHDGCRQTGSAERAAKRREIPPEERRLLVDRGLR